MLIGIVSKPEHCKAHAAGLRADGHDVQVLGGTDPRIPEALDVVVLRAASCSHRASDSAFAWARKYRSALIVENGLSGIRRKLLEAESSKFSEALKELERSRPDDSLETRKKTIKAMGASEQVLATLFEEDTNMGGPIHSYPAPRGEYPSDKTWTQVHTLERLRAAWGWASDFNSTLSDKERDGFIQAYESLEAGYLVNGQEVSFSSLLQGAGLLPKFAGVFNGKPREYTAFLFLLKGAKWVSVKKPLGEGYKSLTGKACDSRLAEALSWFCGNPPPKSVVQDKALFTKLKVASKQADPVVEGGEGPTAPAAAVESNTNAILEVMEDFADFKKQFQKWKSLRGSQADTTEQNLKEAIKTGFDPRTNAKLAQMEKRIGDLFTTQLKNFKHEINRTLEPRVKALEDRSVGAAFRTAIEERMKALEDSSGLALDADRQASDDVSSNPLAALEQVKAALKAAGFKGTLTLTIE